VSIAHVPEQDDTVAGELVQIQALSTVLARNLRVWMEFICGRFQFFDPCVEYPDPGEPIIAILAAISSGQTSGAAEVLLDDSRRFVEHAVAAGVDAELDVWEGMVHGFLGGIGRLAASTEALDLIGSFLTKCFTNSATQRS